MARIEVEKVPENQGAAEMGELQEQIRQLAFHLFQSRGGADGRDLDDWLDAERALILAPEPTLVQRDGKFEICIPTNGYDARDIRVSATPASLVVRAASHGEGQKTMLGTIDLPGAIDLDKTTARLDKGTLYVTAVLRKRAPAAV